MSELNGDSNTVTLFADASLENRIDIQGLTNRLAVFLCGRDRGRSTGYTETVQPLQLEAQFICDTVSKVRLITARTDILEG